MFKGQRIQVDLEDMDEDQFDGIVDLFESNGEVCPFTSPEDAASFLGIFDHMDDYDIHVRPLGTFETTLAVKRSEVTVVTRH